jgi:hypothetical protein
MCRQMSDKAVTDGPTMHPGRSARTLKMYFTEPVKFKVFSSFSTSGWTAPEAERFELGLRRCSLLLRTVHCVNVSFAQFLSEAYLSVADGLPERPRRSMHR